MDGIRPIKATPVAQPETVLEAQPEAACAPDCRDTLWRQGQFFASEDAEDEVFVVISHDCDLAADYEKEPMVEVIKARRLGPDEQAKQLFGKNPRLLQIEVELFGTACVLELTPHNKRSFKKSVLFGRWSQGEEFLNASQLRQLRAWLASRYRRHALPNRLVDRLKALFSKLEEKSKKKADGVLATFLSYSPEEEINDDEPYDVSFAVVYDSDNPRGEENAKIIAQAIKDATDKLENVDVDSVDAFNDMEFTLRDTRTMTELSYEYLSFRGEQHLFTERTH